MRSNPYLQGVLLLLFVTATASLLTSCAGYKLNAPSGPPGPSGPGPSVGHVAIADLNHRVLIYDEPIATGVSASLVLGQPDFNSSQYSGTDATSSSLAPDNLAMDAAGDLFVADETHCRVLEFQPPFTNDMNASVAFGRPSLTTNLSTVCGGDPASTLSAPSGIAIDSHGDLWVADDELSRIFEFVPPFSTGMAPSIVIGNSYSCEVGRSYVEPTAYGLCDPEGIAFDAKGDLWVGDYGYNRLMEFVPPFSTGMAATMEIGQPSFGPQGSCDQFSSSCFKPAAVAFDPDGNLWVTDPWISRILEFRPPFVTGMDASLVLGQPDFTSWQWYPAAANTFGFFGTQYGFVGGLWFDKGGKLFVADTGNSRVLVFSPPFTNDMDASMVIGQMDMTSSTPQSGKCIPPSANTLCFPKAVLTF